MNCTCEDWKRHIKLLRVKLPNDHQPVEKVTTLGDLLQEQIDKLDAEQVANRVKRMRP